MVFCGGEKHRISHKEGNVAKGLNFMMLNPLLRAANPNVPCFMYLPVRSDKGFTSLAH